MAASLEPAGATAVAPAPLPLPPLRFTDCAGSRRTGGLRLPLKACGGLVPLTARLEPGLLVAAGSRGRAYRLGAEVHSGPRSRVWTATAVPDGRPAVLKVIDASSHGQMTAAQQECDLTRRLAAAAAAAASSTGGPGAYHHLVQLLEDWQLVVAVGPSGQQRKRCVVLAMAPLHQTATRLLAHQAERGQRGLPLDVVRSVARQALTALDALHSEQRIVHRDVKPSNLALTRPLFVRQGGDAAGPTPAGRRRPRARSLSRQELAAAGWALLDLGSAAPLSPRIRWGWSPARPWAVLPRVSWEAGGGVPYETPPYSPPEAILQLPSTPAWDIWSLGCTLYEAATGAPLFAELQQAAAAAVTAADSGSEDPGGSAGGEGRRGGGRGGGAQWRRPDPSAADEERWQRRAERATDAAHLALMRRLLGPVPWPLVEASPVSDRFFDARGDLLLVAPGRVPLEERLAGSGALDTGQAAALAGFLGPMLRYEAAERPSARQMLAHPWLADGAQPP